MSALAMGGMHGASPLFTQVPSPQISQRVSTINVTIPFRSIVNIKHLKESMKEILEKSSHSNNRENGAKKGTISFQTLCSKLKESTALKSSTKHLLTVSNCFMSLMHLSTQIGLDLSRIPIAELPTDPGGGGGTNMDSD